jgi:hypothetical protein
MIDFELLGVRAFQIASLEVVSLLCFDLLATHLHRLLDAKSVFEEGEGFVDGKSLCNKSLVSDYYHLASVVSAYWFPDSRSRRARDR